MTWYLWVQEHLSENFNIRFTDDSAPVKKLLVISHLKFVYLQNGNRQPRAKF